MERGEPQLIGALPWHSTDGVKGSRWFSRLWDGGRSDPRSHPSACASMIHC